ncbi:MAG TPA: TonB-dependent receptor [Vicinamibacterales bacterium]|nr:TonB-dependent receptor [Vicinamibacterales bacterium]
MTRLSRLLIVGLLASQAAPARAQSPPVFDLGKATLEDLMNITITSASGKEQRAGDVAAAIYVITQDDIRRSGMTTLPDLLRMVPGVQVARVNANKWAVSVRGFNGQFSNKLLVLVDGRSVYSGLFAGVWWDAEDLIFEDIDRIEVIRGPGAAIWGANAVNGVINILTKSAADTKGALVRVGGGTRESGQATIRYGGSFGSTAYRVYAQGSTQGESLLAPGVGGQDSWRHATVGFRTDWRGGPRALILEGAVANAHSNALWINFDPVPAPNRPGTVRALSAIDGGSLLGRFTHHRPGGASFQMQSSVHIADRHEPVADYDQKEADVDVQYRTPIGWRHDLVAGGGFRVTHQRFVGRTGYSLTPETSNDERVNAFAQDEIPFSANRVKLTLGARVEHDELAGWGVQPTARLTWEIVPTREHLWMAASRALRTPSLAERGLRAAFPPVFGAGPLPVVVTLLGSPDARTEELADIETGYRLNLASMATVAVTGFYGRYQNLRTSESLAPSLARGPYGPYISAPVKVGNLLRATTRGLEFDAHLTPFRSWRLDASYTAFGLTPHLDAASRDSTAGAYDGDAAGQQWLVHSGVSLMRRADLDVTVYRVGALEQLEVRAYTRADARLEVPLTRRLTVSVVGQNLLDASHAEYVGSGATVVQTLVPRSACVQLVWRY